MLHGKTNAKEKRALCARFRLRPAVADKLHTRLDRADDNAHAIGGSVDHLAVADVDARMAPVIRDVARLRVGHGGPVHERVGGSQTRMRTCQTVAYQTGTIVATRADSAPYVRRAKAGICAAHGVRSALVSRLCCRLFFLVRLLALIISFIAGLLVGVTRFVRDSVAVLVYDILVRDAVAVLVDDFLVFLVGFLIFLFLGSLRRALGLFGLGRSLGSS